MFKSKKTFSEIVAPMKKAKKSNPFAKGESMAEETGEKTAVRMVTGAKKKKFGGKKPFGKSGSLISKGMGSKFGKC